MSLKRQYVENKCTLVTATCTVAEPAKQYCTLALWRLESEVRGRTCRAAYIVQWRV